MWDRTKRLINSYLDDLIERTSKSDSDVRQVTRAEVARLNELEIQTVAAAKMLEKELAEVELKMIGVGERQRMAAERGDEAAASSAVRELEALSSQRDLIKQQISEANSSAARARSLREERRRAGEDLANETYLTSMRENIAGLQTPFDSTDPAATLDEMRSRIKRPTGPTIDDRVAEADHQMQAERSRSQVEDLLARYKENIGSGPVKTSQEPPAQQTQAPKSKDSLPASPDDEGPQEPKTLGRADGPVRPVD